jgi:hypothetical protein
MAYLQFQVVVAIDYIAHDARNIYYLALYIKHLLSMETLKGFRQEMKQPDSYSICIIILQQWREKRERSL